MIKFIIAFERQAHLTREQCHDHLENVHGPLVLGLRQFGQLARGYVQNFALDIGLVNTSGFMVDGAAELLFDDTASFLAAYADQQYLKKVRPDESYFANPDRLIVVTARETEVFTCERRQTVKLMRFLARPPHASPKTAAADWRLHYGDALVRTDSVRRLVSRYVQNWSVEEAENPFPLATQYAGVDELWFPSEDEARAFVEWERVMLADLAPTSLVNLDLSIAFAAWYKRVLPSSQ